MKNFYRSLLLFITVALNTNSVSAQWTTHGPVKNRITNCVATSGSTVFAGTQDSGVYISTNNGMTWIKRNTGLISLAVYKIIIDGTDVFAATAKGVFQTTVTGSSWALAGTGIPANSAVVALAKSGSNIFSGDWTNTTGIYRSTNNGANWSPSSSGIPAMPYIQALAANGTTIFTSVATNAGIYVSTNNGSNWSAAGTGLPAFYVNTLATNGSITYAGTGGGGVYKSTNNGGLWTAANNGITNLGIFSVSTSGSNTFAGTNGDGVFLSTDDGDNWSSLGLDDAIVLSVALNDSNLFVATYDSGVWQMPIAGLLTGISGAPANSQNDWTLYPNPATDYLYMPASSPADVAIYNLIGEKVLYESTGAGYPDHRRIDVSALPDGMYLLQSGSGNERREARFVVQH